MNSLLAAPVISRHPQSATGLSGTDLTLSVVATGSGPLSYQWRIDAFPIANATSAVLPLNRATTADSGNYDVIVSDSQGSATSSAASVKITLALYPERNVLATAPLGRAEQDGFGVINQVEAAPDGKWYILGAFTSILGEARAGLARLNADGTLDRSFTAPAFDGAIQRVTPQPDGRLLVGGSFRHVGGVASGGIVRLNSDGTRDAAFAVGDGFLSGPSGPLIYGLKVMNNGAIVVAGAFNLYQGVDTSGLIRLSATGARDQKFIAPRMTTPQAIALASDGRVYVGGASLIGDPERTGNPGVFRLLADGSLDRAFDAGSGAAQGGVRNIFLQKDGRLLVAGPFSSFNGSGFSGLVRLNDNGSVDKSFAVLSTNNDVAAMAQLPDGDLLLGGSLVGRFAGQAVRLKLDGTVSNSFTAPTFNRVDQLAVLASGRIVAAGSYLFAGGGVAGGSGIALLETDGRRTSFNPNLRYSGAITAVRLQRGGKIIVAGQFNYWNGVPTGGPIIRLNHDLSLDMSFRVGVSGLTEAWSVTVQPEGKLIVVGSNSILPPKCWRLNIDGTSDTTFQVAQLAGVIGRPVVLSDKRIMLSDSVRQPGGVVVLASDGSASTSFGSGVSADISAFSALPNGQILIGGGFKTWSGQNKPSLVRLNSDGTVDPAFTVDATFVRLPLGFDSKQNTGQSSGGIILATMAPNELQPANSVPTVIRLLPSGIKDPSFAARLPELYTWGGHMIQPDNRILVWGRSAQTAVPITTRLMANGATDPAFEIVDDERFNTPAAPMWSQALIMDSGDIVAATEDGLLLRYNRIGTPFIKTQPVAVSVTGGQSATFSSTATGPGTLTYQWFVGGTPIVGATSSSLTLPIVFSTHAGQYQVAVSNAEGTTLSKPADLAVDSSATINSSIANVSVRASVDASPLIIGFAVAGGDKRMLIRGIGPGLDQFGVTGSVVDPRIQLYKGSSLVDQNDDWGGSPTLSETARDVGAFQVPTGSRDAMLLSLLSGAHTVQLVPKGPAGIALGEIYDTRPGPATAARLTNVSARYRVGTGDEVLIAGFSVGGTGTKGVLIRGIGPGLTAFGVPGALADPQIAIFKGVARVTENNDWGGTALLSGVFTTVGAFPLAPGSNDAAVIAYLENGSYTVQLSGVGGTTGEGLIEIYELP